ncbi:uncharacterized protein [Spinacia oleracea]|uniref:Reverse transcriptase domain-containing protein n=1 Tax=Spinacia oleracea TaxID=3562 RepID=A0ABM3RP09_SPIOL|nr:uncharacterized protein LOC130471317 [Spinacia oleracea]
MTILYWNARGMGRISFLRNINLLIQQHQPNVIVISETRISRTNTQEIVNKLTYDEWMMVEPARYAGGIVVLWRSRYVSFEPIKVGPQGIHGILQVLSSHKLFFVSFIYASPKFRVRKELWNVFELLAGIMDLPWCIIGDFNEVVIAHEKFGGWPIKEHRANLLLNCMRSCGMLDLGFTGQKFTWTNKIRTGPIMERLDRAWTTVDWLNMFPSAFLKVLPRLTSDHCPILLNLSKPVGQQKPKPFRFEPMWCLDFTFANVLNSEWSKSGKPFFEKLKDLSPVLDSWNKNFPRWVLLKHRGHSFFYKKFWETIRGDLVPFIQSIFRKLEVPNDINETLIAIIPKHEDPSLISQFRPISLCNTVYKIITKVISNRLRSSLPKRISPNQNSFLPGRGTETNVIIANEVLHSMRARKGRRGWFMIKLDLEKAYDKLEWSFIRSSLMLYGLDESSVKIIMSCITSVSSSILVNGIPTDSFSPSRGIRQGDPLSPYIFIICMEVLSHMIHLAVQDIKWTPFKMGRRRVPVSHLLFADDILLVGEVSNDNTQTLLGILEDFFHLSGQSISVEKSRVLFSKNTPTLDCEMFCNSLSIKEAADLNPYLGFPISGTRPTRSSVNFIMTKIVGKLASWKTNFLSKAGRLCLISSVINTMPSYYFQCLMLPKAVLKEINSTMARFLWGKGKDQRGIHLINWDKISSPKDEGGLGIRWVRALNKAFVLKLWWRMVHQEENFAVKVLRDKYSKSNGMFRSFSYGSHLWKAMGRVWECFKESIAWGVGNGKSINLWGDKWIGDLSLRQLISGPLNVGEETLSLDQVLNSGEWNFSIISFEIPSCISNLCRAVSFPRASSINEDFVYSTFSIQGKFDFKKVLGICKKSNPPHPDPKTLFVRHMIDSDVCMCCQNVTEDSIHILRDCPKAREVWERFGISTNFFTTPLHQWLQSNLTHPPPPPHNQITLPWRTLFPSIIWTLWKRRNSIIFQQSQPTVESCVLEAQALAWELHTSRITLPSTSHPSVSVPRWSPPPLHFLMLNCDTSFINIGEICSVAGVFRDHLGEWILGFQQQCRLQSALMGELFAICTGLKISKERGWSKVFISTDSQQALQRLGDSQVVDANLHLTNQCRDLLRDLPDVEVVFAPRSTNKVADRLAKMCRTDVIDRPNLVYFEHPPGYVMDVIL